MQIFVSFVGFASYWESFSEYESFQEFVGGFESFHILFNESTRLMAMALLTKPWVYDILSVFLISVTLPRSANAVWAGRGDRLQVDSWFARED